MTKSEPQTKYIDKTPPLIEGMKKYSYEAMATTFEIFIVHDNETYARQAAMAAFAELDRLETVLSRFSESSEITRINNIPAHQKLRLGLDSFECLKISRMIYEQTNKAFDVTIGPLFNCWRKKDGSSRTPTDEELEYAKLHTGMHLLELNETDISVELSIAPLQVDLGGIGKGYAVDKMAELLREWSINVALISGGYSSVLALDAPAGTKGWPLSLSNPNNRKQILARPFLKNRALSGSGVKKGDHIIDPRRGQPIEGKLAAWSSAPTAAVADSLSTSFMIMQPEEIEIFKKKAITY